MIKVTNEFGNSGVLVRQEEEAGEVWRGDDDPCSQRVPRVSGDDNDGDDDNGDNGNDCKVMVTTQAQ